MDLVTVVGLIVVAVMFLAGAGLVWVGLTRRPDRLPHGADTVLAAVAEGRLAAPARTTVDADAVATDDATEAAPSAGIDLRRPPATPPRAASATPAVRLVPRPEAPATGPAVEPVAASATRDDTADLTDALFG